jgi:peptidoglycan hydrolase-like protein with peptidoglycan-binding domain
MRLAAWTSMIALAFLAQAFAQDATPAPKADAPKAGTATKVKKTKAGKKAAARSEQPAPPPLTATAAQKEAYATLPAAERVAIQSDLVWSGDLSGGLESEFGDRAIAAVRAFQRRNKFEETGILTPEQRQALSNGSRTRKDYVGWRLVEDTVTPGVRLGIPSKLVPKSETGTTSSRWSSAHGEIQIETFREKMAGTTLAELFEEMKKKPSTRRVEASVIQNGSFVISGLQGLKKFYVRVFMKDSEARGLTILFDQAMEGIMLPLVDTITNAYMPFGDAATASTARKVEYGSGIVVTADGHVVTARRLVDNCQDLIVAGLGRAERLADEAAADLALLRVNGAANLKPLAFASDPPASRGEVTLLGIAEPELQGGARNVTTASGKIRGSEGVRGLLDATPARGFAGGAAIDGTGRFAGMIDMPSTNGASRNTAPAFVPAAAIRKFLAAAGIEPATGRSDIEAARNALARVICVRK